MRKVFLLWVARFYSIYIIESSRLATTAPSTLSSLSSLCFYVDVVDFLQPICQTATVTTDVRPVQKVCTQVQSFALGFQFVFSLSPFRFFPPSVTETHRKIFTSY